MTTKIGKIYKLREFIKYNDYRNILKFYANVCPTYADGHYNLNAGARRYHITDITWDDKKFCFSKVGYLTPIEEMFECMSDAYIIKIEDPSQTPRKEYVID